MTRTELRHVMMNMGEKLSEEECDFLVDVSLTVSAQYWRSNKLPSPVRKPTQTETDQ